MRTRAGSAVLAALAAGCGRASPPAVIANHVAPPCGHGETVAGMQVPDSAYMCQLRIDHRPMPWFPCAASSSTGRNGGYSVIQDAGVTSHCTFSGIIMQGELEADVNCRVGRNRRVIGSGTTMLRAVAAGWEGETELEPPVDRVGTLDFDGVHHRVQLIVCRRPWPKRFPNETPIDH